MSRKVVDADAKKQGEAMPKPGDLVTVSWHSRSVSGSLHANPDGSTGGFVAGTAQVEASVHMAPGTRVMDYGRVSGGVRMLGNSMVYDHATISGDTVLFGGCEMHGNVVIDHGNFYSGCNFSTKRQVNAYLRRKERSGYRV